MTLLVEKLRDSRLRQPLAALLLLALFARALLPAGLMPAAGGGFPLQICSSGTSSIGSDGEGGTSSGDDSPCTFAATAVFTVDTTPGLLALALLSNGFQIPREFTALISGFGPARAQRSRAPPV
jgi:hypothetical protein